MLCLIDWARQRHGLASPRRTTLLTNTALQKANEIIRCNNFAHAPCGGDPADRHPRGRFPRCVRREPLHRRRPGTAPHASALDGWLNSPGHRENLFRPEWTCRDSPLVKLDQFGQYRDMTLWVSHFGSN